jgi:hypothetical protein
MFKEAPGVLAKMVFAASLLITGHVIAREAQAAVKLACWVGPSGWGTCYCAKGEQAVCDGPEDCPDLYPKNCEQT